MKKSPLILIFLVIFIDLVGFGMVIPILPYYAKSFGASATVLGMLMMSYSAMQFLFAPLWGQISDRVGRRPILLMSILGIGLSMILLGFASSLTWLFIGRILAGIFGANISTASAYIADVTPPEKRAKGMGLIGAAFGLGFLFGPALGGLLSHWGYGTAAFAAAALSILNFIFAYLKLEEPKLSIEIRQKHRNHFNKNFYLETLGNPKTGLIVFMFFLVTFGFAQLETTFGLFLLSRFGLDATHAGLILALLALVMVIIQGGGIGKLAKTFGEIRLVIIGTVLMSFGLFVASISAHLSLFVIALFIQSIGYAVTNPSLSSLVSKNAKAGSQGATMGVYQSAGSLARMLGPLLAGLLFDRLGMQVPFWASVLFFGITFLIGLLNRQLWNKVETPPIQEASSPA